MKTEDLRSLLNSLTVEEKIGQLVQLSGDFYNASDISLGPQRKLGITQRTVDLSGSVLNVTGADNIHKVQEKHLKKSDHAIPLLFMSDIIYGYKTVYPIPLGMGATWNPELIEKAYENTADEAYASGTHVTFAPMVDLVRDPRWGRVLESTGEDPYLNSRFASAMVRGFQKKMDKGKGIISCVKHFAAYGAVEAGLEYNSADLSLSNLFQNYLPSYKSAIVAGAKMVMTSLTTLNGVPATADKWLLNDILRRQWGFEGIIISDYASVYELTQHGFAENNVDAAEKALNAGVDIDMKSPCYATGLQPLLESGHLSEEKIDQAVWRVLSLKNELGLFEDPYRGASQELEQKEILSTSKRKLARQVSRESLVMLKNEDSLLPLATDQNKKIALIGPYASEKELLGLWAVHGDRDDTITIEKGIREYINYKNLRVAKGTDIIRDVNFFEQSGMVSGLANKVISDRTIEKKNHQEAIDAAKWSDIIIFACGEHTMQSGEAGSRTKLWLPDNQIDLLNELAMLGKPIVTIVISGRPLILTEVAKKSQAIIQAWFPGTEGGHAIADVVFGTYNPSGRLSMSMPYTEGQIPIYYNHLRTGRPQNNSQHVGRFVAKYTDAPTNPLYPFGYGLSYGSVNYHKIELEKRKITEQENLEVRIVIENTSDIERDEIIQMYIRDIAASVVQPVKRLINFQRIHLLPRQKRQLTFTLTAADLVFYDRLGSPKLERGSFELLIGPNSEETQQTSFELI